MRSFEPSEAKQLHSVVSQPAMTELLHKDVMLFDEACVMISWFQTSYQGNTPEKALFEFE